MLDITKQERKYIVYCHCFPNGKKYFGITGQGWKKRWGKGGIGYKGQKVYQAITKYGWYNTKHYILFKGLTEVEAEQKEIELIAQFNTTDRRYGYNDTNGGKGTMMTGSENPMSVKIICINTGEMFDCMNDAAYKYNINASTISECCCDNIKTYTAGKDKDGNHLVWQKYDEYLVNPKDYNTEIRKTLRKKVVCVNTGEIFDTIKEAAVKYNTDSSHISQSCKDTEYRFSAGYNLDTEERLIWQYYYDWIDNPKDPNKYIHYNDKTAKRIICVNTGKIYNSLADASNDTGAIRSAIRKCCNLKQQYAGYDESIKQYLVWAFYDNYIDNTDMYNDMLNSLPKRYRIKCVETGVIYNSAKEASAVINSSASNITRVCRGERNTCKGYHFKYID